MRTTAVDTVHRFHRLDVRVQQRRRVFKVVSATIFIMIGMGVGTLLYVTNLQNDVQQLTVEMQQLEARRTTIGMELRNRRIEYEKYNSPDYIFRMVQEFGLDLRQPAPGQVVRMPPPRSRRLVRRSRTAPGLSRIPLVAQNR